MMKNSKTTVLAGLAAILVAAVALTGGAAASGETTNIDGYSGTTVEVTDAPQGNYSDRAVVSVSLDGSTLGVSNVSLQNSSGASIGSQVGISEIQASIPEADIGSQAGDSATVDVLVDGVVQDSVTVSIVDDDIVSSDVQVNTTTIKNANSVNVTVDRSEINSSENFLSSAAEIRFEIANTPAAATVALNDSKTTTRTVDIKSDSETSFKNFGSVPGGVNSTIYTAESVEKITVDGEVVYEEADGPLGGGGGESGDGLGVGAIALVLVLLAALLVARD